MRESLFLLLAAGGSDLLVPGSAKPAHEGGLSYAAFESLRPKFAPSSWRGILNRLAAQRFLVKRLDSDTVQFRLSRLGEQWAVQNLFSGYMAGDNSQVSVVVLKPREGRKQRYARARRQLEEQGFYHVISGVYASQSGSYSDLLWQSLHDAGFMAVFFRVGANAAQPIGFRELLGDQNDEYTFQRKWTSVEQELSKLTVREEQEKKRTPAQKAAIGENIVSGLSLISSWSPLLYGEVVTRSQVEDLLRLIMDAYNGL